jgi:hypothetical protein
LVSTFLMSMPECMIIDLSRSSSRCSTDGYFTAKDKKCRVLDILSQLRLMI